MSRLSLRTRLLVGVIALAAVGLFVADAVTYRELHSFLLGRVDTTLQQDHIEVENALRQVRSCDGLQLLGPNAYVQLETADQSHTICTTTPQGFGGQSAPAPPQVPSRIVLHPSREDGGERLRYLTVPATSGGDQWRLRASLEGSVVIIVGDSLHDVHSTLHRLLLVELLVTLVVLAAVAALGLWVVRLGLKPLSEIEETAAAITAGDLSRRVEHADPQTEVGRVGSALNTMLDRIETSDQIGRAHV